MLNRDFKFLNLSFLCKQILNSLQEKENLNVSDPSFHFCMSSAGSDPPSSFLVKFLQMWTKQELFNYFPYY